MAELIPPLGNTTPQVFMFNVQNLDKAMNGDALIWKDRGDIDRDSWAGLQKKFLDALNEMALSGGTLGFNSEEDLLAYAPTNPNTIGVVVTTGDAWLWSGTAWKYSGLSFTEQAMQYVDDLLSYTEIGLTALTGHNYLNPVDGSRVFSANWLNSGFIPAKARQKIRLTAVCLSDQQANIAFYDANHEFISSGRTGAENTVKTARFTVPQDGYMIICTRTATSTEFSCKVTNAAVSDGQIDTLVGVASTGTAMSIAGGADAVAAIKDVTKEGPVAAGYIDNNGELVESGRRYRSVQLTAGETAFYSGYSRSSQTTVDQISAVIFKPETGNAEIIKGLPRTLAGACWYSGEYTTQVAGTLSINLESDPKNLSTPFGYLLAGIPGATVLRSPKKLMATEIGKTVAGKPLSNRDIEAITANGTAVDVTASAEIAMNQVLYSNGAYQDLSLSTAVGQWCTKLVPVREGDKVTFYGVFNTSSSSVLSYISQLDEQKNYVEELLGANPDLGYQTVVVTASQDGYIAIRVRLLNTDGSVLTHTITRTGPKYFTGGSDPVVVSGEGAICAPSMERLPIKLDSTWLYNSPSYQQNGIVTAGDYQYVICIAEGRLPHILQRSIFGGPWTRFDLSTIPGNPFSAPNAQDGHNSFSIAVTKNGYILVTGNHHAVNCKCVISNSPHNITSWSQIFYTDDTVTYPRFLVYPDGTLQVFWRQGTSGNGTYYMNTFDDAMRQFGTKKLLISAPDGGNPYEQTICVDNQGVLHLCWGYRSTASSADANSGMYYAKSANKGGSFTNASGSQGYSVPLHSGNSERPVIITPGSGYVNQNGACVDLNGRYHTVYWQQDADGYTQIVHLYFDGALWRTETVSAFTYTEVTSGSLLNGTSSRPQICCTRYGKIYVIYRTTEDGLAGQVRCIDVTTPGAPVDQLLIRFNVNRTELSVNVWEVLQTGILCMMLYNGVNRVASNPEGKYLSECAWLMQAQLP